MDGFVEEAFASALGVLAITRILFDVGDHTRIKNALAIGSGVKAAVEIDISTSEVQSNLFGHLLQRFQALWEQDHDGLIDGRHRDRRQTVALVLYNGDNLLPPLVFLPREPNPITPFLATVLVPSPWSTRRSSCFSAARCRTPATNARQSDPSSAHFAKTLYTVV